MQEIIQWAKEHWNLKGITLLYECNNKQVYSAESCQWGDVIIKVNRNIQELLAEFKMLKAMNGNNCCKVFEFDAGHNILIEERICPGIALRYEQNVEIRVPHFLKIFSSIHRTISSTEIFPIYLDWLHKAEIFCLNHNINNTITDKMHIAHHIGEEMFFKYSDRVLLHGDLHHDNMLLKDHIEYFMIDPKGVIGPEIFDLPRFIFNEMDFCPKHEQKKHVLKVVDMIAKNLNYPTQDIIKLFFMEVMLANVWFIEEGKEPNLHQILIATELFNE